GDWVGEERGWARVKGFEDPTRFWEAFALPPGAAGRVAGDERGRPSVLEFATETPLVGRDHEMRWARGTWRQVRRGYGRVVAVSGASQVGKTRPTTRLPSYR